MSEYFCDEEFVDTKEIFEEQVVGKVFDFYGIDNKAFKLGEQVWEAVEDEDDGYRSLLGSILLKETDGLIFFSSPLAKVCVKKDINEDVYEKTYSLVDEEDGHVWLRFGTLYWDEYYPYFAFHYEPKNPDEMREPQSWKEAFEQSA